MNWKKSAPSGAGTDKGVTMELTQEIVRSRLGYRQDNGEFFWRHNGKKAGCKNVHPSQGYVVIRIAGKLFRAHRLAWLYVHGEWPKNEIDHINGDRSDNRICNLREATSTQNKMNTSLRSDNKSGVRGVSWHKQVGMWRATIKFDGKQRLVGLFHSLDEARHARKLAEAEVFGAFQRDDHDR